MKEKMLNYKWTLLPSGAIAVIPDAGGPVALNNQALVETHNKVLAEVGKLEGYFMALAVTGELPDEARKEFELPFVETAPQKNQPVNAGAVKSKKSKADDAQKDDFGVEV